MSTTKHMFWATIIKSEDGYTLYDAQARVFGAGDTFAEACAEFAKNHPVIEASAEEKGAG